MIERLMTNHFLQDNPGYQEITQHIAEIRHAVSKNLDPEDREMMERLADAYIGQCTMLVNDAFTSGFCAAVELALEILQHRSA